MDSETKEILRFLEKASNDALKREAADLIEKQDKNVTQLTELLRRYRTGGLFPTYAELIAITGDKS